MANQSLFEYGDPPKVIGTPGFRMASRLANITSNLMSPRMKIGEKKPFGNIMSDINIPTGLRQKVVNSIYPYGYAPNPMGFIKAITNPKSTEENLRLDLNMPGNRNRYDAFNLYSDLTQKYDTFVPGEYRPTMGNNKKSFYYKFKNPQAERRYVDMAAKYGLLDKEPGTNMVISDNWSVGGNSVMNQGTIGYGKDDKGFYISCYDRWDLAGKDKLPVAKNLFGRPFNIYGRVYLSDKEVNVLRNKYKTNSVPYLTKADVAEPDFTDPNSLLRTQVKTIAKQNNTYLPETFKELKQSLYNLGNNGRKQ